MKNERKKKALARLSFYQDLAGLSPIFPLLLLNLPISQQPSLQGVTRRRHYALSGPEWRPFSRPNRPCQAFFVRHCAKREVKKKKGLAKSRCPRRHLLVTPAEDKGAV